MRLGSRISVRVVALEPGGRSALGREPRARFWTRRPVALGQRASAGAPRPRWRGELAVGLDPKVVEPVRAEEAARAEIHVPEGQVLHVGVAQGEQSWLWLGVETLVQRAGAARVGRFGAGGADRTVGEPRDGAHSHQVGTPDERGIVERDFRPPDAQLRPAVEGRPATRQGATRTHVDSDIVVEHRVIAVQRPDLDDLVGPKEAVPENRALLKEAPPENRAAPKET